MFMSKPAALGPEETLNFQCLTSKFSNRGIRSSCRCEPFSLVAGCSPK